MEKYVNNYIEIPLSKCPVKNANNSVNDEDESPLIILDETSSHTVNSDRQNFQIRNIVTPILHHYKKSILNINHFESDKEILVNQCAIQNITPDKIINIDEASNCTISEEDTANKIVIRKPNYTAVYNKEYQNNSVICDICKKYFSNAEVLEQHKKNHSRRRNLKCDICSKTFARWDYFNRHLKAHSMNESYVCNLCGKSFGCLDHQKMHMRTHARNGYVKCEFCEETFTHMNHYKKHSKVHEEFPITCNYCNETFMRLQELRQHMHMKHTGEHNFRCDDCGQTFTRSYHLEGHIRTVHNGEHPFKCNVCDKIFTRLAHMKVHVCTPSESYPFNLLELSHM